MKPAVIELQEMAMDNSIDLTACLRRALAISSKLGLEPFKRWISLELEGYGKTKIKELPNYRVIGSSLVARNPYTGLIPFIIDDSKMMKELTTIYVTEPVHSLIHVLKNAKGTLEFPVTHDVQTWLMKMQDWPAMEVTRKVSPNSVGAILDRVRTQLLNFSLELENSGVIGDGIHFSDAERKKASAMEKSINIGVFQGVMGDVSNSNIQQNLVQNIQKRNFSALETYLANAGVSPDEIQNLEQAISKDNLPEHAVTFGENVSSWIGRMVSKAASGVWAVGVGAAGNLLGDALKQFYGF